MARTHALYRFYGDDGALLYIGITFDPGNRWRAHREDKPWWHEVADIRVQTYPDRASVLAAERAAIVAEQPRYNVVHNRKGANHWVVATPVPDESVNEWKFYSRRSGVRKVKNLRLSWEVSGTPMSDDWLPEEISADRLMRKWLDHYGTGQTASIYWFVSPVCESAPFQENPPAWGDFLTYYTWPVHVATGDPLNWNHLPVVDFNWSSRGDKGGFFQEATGWKPAPLQAEVPLGQVLAMAGAR